jgi:light-regulated signal transduction histidine kinase (bacteriophytochrome)
MTPADPVDLTNCDREPIHIPGASEAPVHPQLASPDSRRALSAQPSGPEFDPSGASLDLSFSVLRSVSPIHIEYLTNMHVTASMSCRSSVTTP